MTRKTRIHLIRHGEVAGAGIPRYNGHADVSLSERGVEQYHALKPRLEKTGISACYSSDLQRAHHTAQAIAAATGAPLRTDAGLRERGFGIFEGKTYAEIQAMWQEDDYWTAVQRQAGEIDELITAFNRDVGLI